MDGWFFTASTLPCWLCFLRVLCLALFHLCLGVSVAGLWLLAIFHGAFVRLCLCCRAYLVILVVCRVGKCSCVCDFSMHPSCFAFTGDVWCFLLYFMSFFIWTIDAGATIPLEGWSVDRCRWSTCCPLCCFCFPTSGKSFIFAFPVVRDVADSIIATLCSVSSCCWSHVWSACCLGAGGRCVSSHWWTCYWFHVRLLRALLSVLASVLYLCVALIRFSSASLASCL